MEQKNLSLPGNPRYQPKDLQPIFGYDNLYRQLGRVEIATLQVLGEIGVIPPAVIRELTPEIMLKLLDIRTTQVDQVERQITHHDVRAWVRIAQQIVGEPLAQWVHIPLTSYDAIDTARVLQFLQAYSQALNPALSQVTSQFADLTEREAETLQIGRTHGQHALPITVGFWLATILSRIIYNWQQLDHYANGLVGKISGAVGAHNAQFGLQINQKCGDVSFEDRVLAKLDLKPAPISTQILPPEPLAYFLFSCGNLSAVLAQFGRDCRHLMRTEIGEVAEAFEAGQVGSSTMPHKRNPISFENAEGMWFKTFAELQKVLLTLISEHQRDLTASSVLRDFPIIMVNLQQQLNSLLRTSAKGKSFLQRLTVSEIDCQRNFALSSHLILAEPMYIALQMAGYPDDAHELVNRQIVPLAQERRVPIVQILEEMAQIDEKLQGVVNMIPTEVRQLLHHPEQYTGDAAAKAIQIAKYARQQTSILSLRN